MHQKIQKAQETFVEYEQLKIDLDNLFKLVKKNNVPEVKNFLKKIITNYNSNSNIVDYTHLSKK